MGVGVWGEELVGSKHAVPRGHPLSHGLAGLSSTHG